MGNGDNFALDWIRGELESTLDQARVALESYAEGGREETRLRSCLTSLHQVHGTLRMLELEGVVLLADHMEQTAQSLLNGSIQDSRVAEQTLMQSILQLPAFIEEVQNGVSEDLPLVMPYVNELRSCCGLSPMQLTPPVSAEFSSEQAAEVMRRFRDINGADKAARVRAAYQQVLLSIIKGAVSEQTVETLAKIAIGMQRICEGAPLATLWKALEHFAKGYAAEPQKMSSEALRDLRRLDKEMKKLVALGAEALVEPLPVDLVRDLLRVAEARGVHSDEITELRSAVALPQAAPVKPREALEQAGEVLAEEIATVRDRFDLFTRGKERTIEQLKEITEPLDTICLTLSMLGDDDGANLLRVERAKILAADAGDEVSDELTLSIAGALVQTEQGLSGGGDIASGDDALADAALNDAQMVVLQEARNGIDQVKQSIVDFVSSKWNTGYLDDAPQTLAAVRGGLVMIPLSRAAELLTLCSEYISEQLLAGHRPDWQELDAFADALGGVDYFLERLFETGRMPGDEALDLTQESLSRLSGIAAEVSPELDTNDSEQPLSGSGGDAALTAMLGASPEDLAFASDEVVRAEEQDVDNVPSADSETSLATTLELESVGSDEPLELDDASTEEPLAELLVEAEAGDETDEQTESAVVSTSAEVTAVSEDEFDLADDSSAKDASPAEDESVSFDATDLVDTSFVSQSIPAVINTMGTQGATNSTVGMTPDLSLTDSSAAFGANDSKADLPAALPVEPARAPVTESTDIVVDPEIVEIFVEEVDEVLEAVEAQLPSWSQNLASEAPLTELRRSFHTLKGSGRIVGANQIGELGWALENMLNRVLDRTIKATEDHLFLVSHACKLIPQLRADFAQGEQSERSGLIDLLEQVDVLASGGALTKQLVTSSDESQLVLQDQAPIDLDELDEEDFPIFDDGEQALDDIDARPPAVDVPSFLDNDTATTDSFASMDAGGDERLLFVQEIQEHVEVLSERVRRSLGEDTLELDSPLTRALHTIAGSAATAGDYAVVGVAEPLQDVCSVVLRERNGILDGEYLAFVREGVYALQRMLDVDAPLGERDDRQADIDSAMFATEAERLLGGLLEAPNAPTSLLEMADTTILLDAREYLDHWRFGAIDLARAEQMDNALINVVERAHSEEFAELANVLRRAHAQFADTPLDEERHVALVAVHDDLLVQLDALAAGQVSVVSGDALNRLVDLLGEVATATTVDESLDEPLDDDAQEALGYELDESDAFDLGALDDDIFGANDAAPISIAEVPVTETVSLADASATSDWSVGRDAQFEKLEEDDEVDTELLEIFYEEADEILELFDQNLQDWRGDRANKVYLDNLLRGLHTLKGGARLAGLSILGDMTHDYESELIELQAHAHELSDGQMEAVHARYDDLVEATTRARAGELVEPPVVSSIEHAQVESGVPAPSDDDVEVSDIEDSDAEVTDVELAVESVSDLSSAVDSIDADLDEVDLLTPEGSDELLASLDDLDVASDESEQATAVIAGVALASAIGFSSEADGSAEETQHAEVPSETIKVAPHYAGAEPADDDRSSKAQEMVRVSASLLEDLVNLAGESSIVRARVEQGINDFGGALEEMETTIERLREQLRQLEIETETRVSSREERSSGPSYEEFDPLEMDRYSQLQQLTRSLTESATDMMDLKETLRYRARESETLLLQQARLNTELQEGLMRTRMVPFSRLMPRLRRIVRQVSRDLDKQVEFQAYNAEGELDRNVLERMVPPLEHMLRNAIDHGIESKDLRHSFGKPSIGHIALKLSREGGDVVLEISDDGAGIDVETVRAKAVERGLMASDAALNDEQVLEFVLAPGFSTAKSLTQISGRGVGMDVVHSEVKQLGGSISISSVPGRGTTFTVRLPFTVSVNRALMVTLGDDQYAIPLNTIEGIVLLPSEDLSKHYGPQGVPFEYAGVPYRVRYLGGYLGREYVAGPEHSSVPVVLVRSGDQAVAVHVDDVQGSREIVVKSLGPQFAGVGGISGATILGDGSVVIILDLLSLMRTRNPGFTAEGRVPSAIEEELWVLVVDDSVTVRKVTSRLLERQGMNVMTAKDGVEAVSVLQERRPDIVLLDIEMPRMDGFEVARQVRHDDRLADLPIVMISSRTGAKHTERARELGVNRFLGKPFQENELLEVIDELVKRG